VTAVSAGLPDKPCKRVSKNGVEARQPGGGVTTTPRRWERNAFSKCTKDSPASSCSAPSTGLWGSAVKRALNVVFEAAAGRVDPWPRSSVNGWANV